MKKLVLVGDSIRLGYQAEVVRQFAGWTLVAGPSENCESSREVLKNAQQWIVREQPDVLHMNCGLHDLRIDPRTMTHNVPLTEYVSNLEVIFRLLATLPRLTVVWATLTPVLEARHNGTRYSIRYEGDVARYDAAARAVALAHGAAINDLHAAVVRHGAEQLLREDGLHFRPEGSNFLATQVVAAVREPLLGCA
jgi:isoamyl acetate esterase